MQDIDVYCDLFFNSFYSGLFFSFDKEYVIWFLNSFDNKSKMKLDYFFVALLSFTFASIVNYTYGLLAYFLAFRNFDHINRIRYNNFANNLKNHLGLFLLLLLFPLVNTLVFLILGFFRIRLIRSLYIGLLIKFFYYFMFLYIIT